jgi:hypothetical protein
MAGAGKKTFTAGEILTASDTNTYLMEQTVMYFAGTAARSSAIPTPSTGMTTYIGATGTATIAQIESYTGSAFQTLYGMTQVANVSFTGAASFSMDNVFTTTYDNYRILFEWDKASGSPARQWYNYIKSDGTAFTGTYSTALFSSQVGNTGTNNLGGNYTNYGVMSIAGIYRNIMELEVRTPAKTGAIDCLALGRGASSDYTSISAIYVSNASTKLRGITFYPDSGTMTGTARVYGYRNS